MPGQSRRDFLKTLGSAAALGAAAVSTGMSFSSCSRDKTPPPNVILILTDDQGYGDVGRHGNDKIRTPRLDGLYDQSVRFTNFYSCPLCAPTRSSLMTGRYNYRTGVVDTWVGWALMRAEEVTAAEMMKDAGYRTGIFGKWHLGDDYPMRPGDQGFDECLIHKGGGIGGRANPPDNKYYDPVLYHNEVPVPTTGYCTDIFFDAALKFIEQNSERPFFAYIPTNVPHIPLEIHDEEAAPYLAMGLDESTAKHYAMLTNLDQNLGRLLDRLDSLSLSENTVVIFMTDNGPVSGRYNAGLRENKGSVYDGGIKVPFFIRWPQKLKAGIDIDRIGAHIDVLPTILSLCGIPKPDAVRFDGADLSPLLFDAQSEWPDRTLYFQQCRPDSEGMSIPKLFTHCSARGQKYKIVMTAKDRRRRMDQAVGFEETELFDMEKDPGEKTDISADHPDIVRRMRADYEAWFRDVTDGLAPACISLGAPEQNPVLLTNQDLFGPGSAVSYSSWSRMSRNPEEEPAGTGVWNVQVERSGRYRVAFLLSRPELENPLPLKSGEAMFKLGGIEETRKIVAGDTRVEFELSLEKTRGELVTLLTGQRRDGNQVTPFFITVEYLGAS